MRRPHRLAFYGRHMESLGFPASAVLAGTGLDMDKLLDAGYLVDDIQCSRVIENMLTLTNNPGLGFDTAGEIHAEDFGIVGNAMLSAPSFREAGLFLQKYNDLSGGLARFLFFSTGRGEQWRVVVEPALEAGDNSHFCIEEFLCMTVALGETLTGKRFRLHRVDLSFPRPRHANLYTNYFACPVFFDQPSSALTVESPGLDTPLPGSNAELSELFHRHCQQTLRQISGEESLRRRLRSLFIKDIGDIPKLEVAAKTLGLSGRTLRRRLQGENCSYRDLVSEFRIDMAKELLRADQLSVKEISYQLGYANSSAFRRAFKSETGTSVGQYRQQHTQHGANSR